jgi:hypothetical protein
MKTAKRLTQWFLGAAIIFAGFAGQIKAADYVDVDIHVSINAIKDVSASATYYYFGAIDINTSTNSVGSITITNASTGITETYTIKGGTATSDTAGTNWNLVASSDTVGSETYAMAVLFTGAGRPNNNEATWGQDYLRVDQFITCTTNVFGDGTPGDQGASVAPGAARTMYFRLHTPTDTVDGGPHTATIRLSVL